MRQSKRFKQFFYSPFPGPAVWFGPLYVTRLPYCLQVQFVCSMCSALQCLNFLSFQRNNKSSRQQLRCFLNTECSAVVASRKSWHKEIKDDLPWLWLSPPMSPYPHQHLILCRTPSISHAVRCLLLNLSSKENLPQSLHDLSTWKIIGVKCSKQETWGVWHGFRWRPPLVYCGTVLVSQGFLSKVL